MKEASLFKVVRAGILALVLTAMPLAITASAQSSGSPSSQPGSSATGTSGSSTSQPGGGSGTGTSGSSTSQPSSDPYAGSTGTNANQTARGDHSNWGWLGLLGLLGLTGLLRRGHEEPAGRREPNMARH